MPADPAVDHVDVTNLFSQAQEQLRTGEMVHDNLNLFEAMSAVEIGNVKMDAGAVSREPPVPLGDRPLPLALTPGQQLAVMDQILALEATWFSGHPLAQTLYSSLYMLQLPRWGAQPRPAPHGPRCSVCRGQLASPWLARTASRAAATGARTQQLPPPPTAPPMHST